MKKKKWYATALFCTLLLVAAIVVVAALDLFEKPKQEEPAEPQQTEDVAEPAENTQDAEPTEMPEETPSAAAQIDADMWNEIWAEDKYPMADMSLYVNIPEGTETHFREMETIDVCNEIDNGTTFIVIFSHAKCPHCAVVMPELNKFAEENGLEIGYVNVRKDPMWKTNLVIDNYKDLVERVGDYFPLDEFERKHMYVPHIFFIVNGEVFAQMEGAFDYDGSGDPLSAAQIGALRDFWYESAMGC